MTTDDLLKQGIAAMKAGRKAEARRLLTQVIQQDERNEMAWQRLSGAVNTVEDRRVCLENVLAISPNNSVAWRRLERLLVDRGVSPLNATPMPDSSTSPVPERQTPAKPREAVAASRTAPPKRLEKAAKRGRLTCKQLWLFIGVAAVLVIPVCVAVVGLWWALDRRPLSSRNTWTRPDDMVMIYVPAGEFQMGSSDRYDDRQGPIHTVSLDAFWIDRTELTNEQYQRCVGAGHCDAHLDTSPYALDSHYGNYPVIWVIWRQAANYCSWAGARLPTEAEWEYAARGPDARVYPWGDEFDGSLLNSCDTNCPIEWADKTIDDGYVHTAPVGSYPGGASWRGALDMAGNVREWVSDWSAEYDGSPARNPTGPSSGELRVVRGDGWAGKPVGAAVRGGFSPEDAYPFVGFRCARDAE